MKQPDKELIPSLNEWRPEDTWYTWLASSASFEHAIAYSQIFWPEFIEYQGSVFLAYNFCKDSINEWKARLIDTQELERLCNHQHILHILGTPGIVANEKQLDYVGNLLHETWNCKLKKDYPDKSFTVEYSHGSQEDLMNYMITFCSIR